MKKMKKIKRGFGPPEREYIKANYKFALLYIVILMSSIAKKIASIQKSLDALKIISEKKTKKPKKIEIIIITTIPFQL